MTVEKSFEIVLGLKPAEEGLSVSAPTQSMKTKAPDTGTLIYQPIPLDAGNMANEVLSVRDYRSFERFVLRYGLQIFAVEYMERILTMNEDEFGRVLLKYANAADVPAEILEYVWQEVQSDFTSWQNLIQMALNFKRGDPASYPGILNGELLPTCRDGEIVGGVRLFASEGYRDLPRAGGRYDEDEEAFGSGFHLYLVPSSILTACYLSIALSRQDIAGCQGKNCDNLFIKTRGNGKYCSDKCREAIKHQGKDWNYRNMLRGRVQRNASFNSKQKNEMLAALRKDSAKTIADLKAVENKYGLAPRR